MAQKNNKLATKIGLGYVLGWVIGLFLIFLGLAFAGESNTATIVYIIGGLLVIPTVWELAESKLHFTLSLPLRIVLFLILYLIAFGVEGAFTR